MFFIIEEAKETVWNFSQGTVKVLWMCQYKMVHDRLLGPLLKTGLLLIKNINKPLAESVLIPLTAAASAADTRKDKKAKDLEQQHYQYYMMKWKIILE